MANWGISSGSKSTESVTVGFRIPYYTHWGQSLLVCGSEPVLGSWNVKKGVLLAPSHHGDELIWRGSITVPSGYTSEYSYYVVDDGRNVLRWEMGEKRRLVLPEGVKDGDVVELYDLWQTGSDTLPFRSAFKDVIFRRSASLGIERPLAVLQNNLDEIDSVLIHFRICCPSIEEDTAVYVIGSCSKLGQWKIQNGVKLSHGGDSVWHADCVVQRGDFPLKYKYCTYGKAENISLEIGSQRELSLESSKSQPRYIFLSDGMFRGMPWRGAGVAIPMFSVRSEEDVGVGEFLDLKLLVDWAVESGFHLVQLLPISDTSVHGMWWDSYPYSSLSVFALHPLYLRLDALSKNIPNDIKHDILKAKEELDKKEEKKPKAQEEAKKLEEVKTGKKPEKAADEEKKREKKAEESKDPPPPPPEIVLKVNMYCEGCASKVHQSLNGFDGVEEVTTDCGTQKVVVKGEKADPLKVKERVKKKLNRQVDLLSPIPKPPAPESHRQVELLSPIPEPPAPEEKKPEQKEAPKPEEKKEEDVDYEATMAAKLSIAKKIFSLEKNSVLNSSTFQKFFSENEEWLKPYAAFCFLRDFFETSDHSQWGRFSQFSKEQLDKLVSKESFHYDIICFHYYIQFHLHLQLSEAARYAREKGVVLKGDLPIGVDRNSVDTWVYPNLFRMNTATGAPPDYFDKNGQNWGFPTYNWEEMSKDNYAWWRARLTQMAKYFTAYRIDHILGFFRIWELPEHAMTGLVGKFRPSIPLSQEELEREGIWDFNRLSNPYVRQELLQEKFGESWPFIASNFFNEYEKHHYEFKEDCKTEKKIAAKLKSFVQRSLLEDENKIRRNLFDLLQNIVLIRDPEDAKKFYPRFNLEDTTSFMDLDDHSKNVLKRLYYDYYFHRQDNLWRQNALKTLPVLLNCSDMLACGEDLGLIPSCVHPVMQELGLVGLRIQRMPSESDLEFGIPSQYSYMTVCAPSCHDCSTLRAWWEEDEERRRRFFKNVVGSDKLPPSKCVPDVAYFVLRQHVEAPSMWAIFPLQDLLVLKGEYMTRPATEETINDPTNPKHYWRYRAHVTLEALMKDRDLISTIKNLIRGSGRSHPLLVEANTSSSRETGNTTTEKKLVSGEALTAQLKGAPQRESLVVS